MRNKKRDFFQKLSNLELWCLLTTYRKLYLAFSKNPLLDPQNPRWLTSAILKIDMTSLFSAESGPIWIKFRRLVQNDMSTAVMWLKSKPDVEFQYGGRLSEFNGRSSQNHLPHCRVLPHGEFNVVIPELRVTLWGAATWWIHCHNSRATCHIAGCTHLAKSMSWSCHIAGCKNSIRHIENRFLPYFFLMQSRFWWAAAFLSSLKHLL